MCRLYVPPLGPHDREYAVAVTLSPRELPDMRDKRRDAGNVHRDGRREPQSSHGRDDAELPGNIQYPVNSPEYGLTVENGLRR